MRGASQLPAVYLSSHSELLYELEYGCSNVMSGSKNYIITSAVTVIFKVGAGEGGVFSSLFCFLFFFLAI